MPYYTEVVILYFNEHTHTYICILSVFNVNQIFDCLSVCDRTTMMTPFQGKVDFGVDEQTQIKHLGCASGRIRCELYLRFVKSGVLECGRIFG